jgi:hypothetical protein
MNSQMNDDELKNMSGCPLAGCDKIFSNHLTFYEITHLSAFFGMPRDVYAHVCIVA